jgi:N6-L-threonylcarbamoyladenine synthase
MKILAFETSCDDTAVAIVENGTTVLSSVRVSQLEHNKYGGVVPEIAARLHSENWRGVMEEAFNFAGFTEKDIDAIAVTNGPGLQTSLLTGTTAASFLSLLWKKPLIPVHHIFGHISSVYLDDKKRGNPAKKFPVLVLTVSGGHTEFFLQKTQTKIIRLGGTLDDAAGEAFDKVAKMLGLGYPGGPIVSKRAEKGDRQKFKFPQPMLEKTSLDFSFSGVKSAVYREIEAEKLKYENFAEFSDEFINNVCASFEQTVTEIFIKKIRRAISANPKVKAVHFVGGVSANNFLRKNLTKFLESQGRKLRVPSKLEYCTDNAAMIGSAAFWLYEKNPSIAKIKFINANSRLKI